MVEGLKAYVARGNNDDLTLAAYYAYKQAGDAPAPKFEFVKRMTNSDADFIAELPFSVSLPEYGVCVVHGGGWDSAFLTGGDGCAWWGSAEWGWALRKGAGAACPARAGRTRCVAHGRRSLHACAALRIPCSLLDPPAGLVPEIPLKQQDLWAVCYMRDLYKWPHGWQAYEGDKLLTPIGAVAFASAWQGPPHVIFGHDSKRSLQLARHATGVDTGCAGGGELTAAVLPPLRVLRRSEVFKRKLAAGEALTLDDLQGRTVSVPSQQLAGA